MKKQFVFIVMVLFSTALFAQQSKTMTPKQTSSKSTMTHDMKDCVMMMDGKMMMMKAGKTMPMSADMKMENGSMVDMKGNVMMPDGSKKMMKNGDCVDMKGMWMKPDMKSKNATPAENKKQAEMKTE